MRIQLSEHFTYSKLLRFTLPSVVMMIFTSIYSVVDGVFVSNFAGKTPFAAVNLIMPLLIILGAPGFMLGAGGSAIVARTLGEGERDRANEYFSLLVWAAVAIGAAAGLLGMAAIRPAAILLGAEGEMLSDCVLYGRIILTANAFFVLQCMFQSLFIAAEKPRLGLYVTVGAGLTNMAGDAILVGVLGGGLTGAALATALSQAVGALVPILYFARENDSLLRLGRTRFYGHILRKTCANGSSELMSNVSSSVVTTLYNYQLLRLAGEDGVAAYGAVMYVAFIFAAVSVGYAVGSAPIVSFHYGAGNRGELRSLLRRSMTICGLSGAAMAAAAFLAAPPLSRVFVGYDPALCAMTVRGFRIFALSYLLAGYNIYASSFFTALNNGPVSAAISFLRTLVFQCGSIIVLPLLLGLDGVWISVTVAEAAALAVSLLLLAKNRRRYGY